MATIPSCPSEGLAVAVAGVAVAALPIAEEEEEGVEQWVRQRWYSKAVVPPQTTTVVAPWRRKDWTEEGASKRDRLDRTLPMVHSPLRKSGRDWMQRDRHPRRGCC